MTLSHAAEIIFLTATVPVLLRVNHERDGRLDGRTATMAIGEAAFCLAFPVEMIILPFTSTVYAELGPNLCWPRTTKVV